MDKLTKMANIGAVIERNLQKAGVNTPEQLRGLGSREAFTRIRMKADPAACLSMLYALEGAVRGVRWHALPEADKRELAAFYKTL